MQTSILVKQSTPYRKQNYGEEAFTIVGTFELVNFKEVSKELPVLLLFPRPPDPPFFSNIDIMDVQLVLE